MKEQGIPISTLSATFRDAIAFCKKVDINFLWIDALCIIQDSEDDRDTEALLLSKVYRYSYLNLAAIASENADGGLFYERNPLDVNLLRLTLWLGVNVRDCYLLRRPFHASPQILNGSPLNRSWWVTQERFISPRTIHFASGQLHWECPELMACEIFPAGMKWDESFSRTLDWRKLIETSSFDQFRSSQEHPTTGQIQRIWSQLVAYYTHCQLTFPSDKLIAISGLAKIVSEISGDKG